MNAERIQCTSWYGFVAAKQQDQQQQGSPRVGSFHLDSLWIFRQKKETPKCRQSSQETRI